jgi:hypothetical protein
MVMLASLCLIACKTGNQNKVKKTSENSNAFVPQFIPGPQALVYKTKHNYANLIPVVLSDDKTTIVSYPHPNDVKSSQGVLKPTELLQGYLLDNKGIGENVAFLKYTYEEYALFEEAPNLAELYDQIIDKDPLLELCNCGNISGFVQMEQQLNELIETQKLRSVCKTIK